MVDKKYQANGEKKLLNASATVRILHEKSLLKKNYDEKFVRSEILWNNGVPKLVCHIHYDLLDEDIHFKIEYKGRHEPKAWIISPQIDNPQHIYPKEKNLCLFDPRTDEWNDNMNIFNTFVPWCQQWIIFQRLYEQTGQWMHPERHPSIGDNKENEDVYNKSA